MAEMRDLVVIGAGPGGFAAAMRAAQLGSQVTLVEQAHYGGNCMNCACIPSKHLMTVARQMITIRQAERTGIQVEEPQADMEAIHRGKDTLIQGLRLGTEQLLRGHGVTLIQGHARLHTPDTVQVDEQRIQTHNVILATGSMPALPPIAGIDLPGVIGTEEALELREIPKRLAILGSQPWDLEMAQYFNTMGSQITLIETGQQLLPEADHEIAQRLGKLLYDAGIALRRGVQVDEIRQGKDAPLAIALSDGQVVAADRLLAARRLPNAIGLGIRDLGIATDRGAIQVDDRMQTKVPHIYAVGDVASPLAGGPPATGSHRATVEGLIAAENACAAMTTGPRSSLDPATIPHCLYTWPEVAWVGLSEEQAAARGIEFRVGKAPLAVNPYALILDQTAGVCKILVGRYDKILGAHIIAPGAVDLINTIAVAMLAEATLRELICLVPMHPAIGETLVDAAMDVQGRSLHWMHAAPDARCT
jgi:dihydrolipoamide dehydrogenase